MAPPKFPLKMGDGSEVRTLEELRKHADFDTLVAHYSDGALRRWLRTWGFVPEAEKVEQMDNEAEGFHRALYDALGISWTEETEADFTRYIDKEIERELEAQQKEEDVEPEEEETSNIQESEPALAIPTMDDAMADEIARLLNYHPYSTPRFVEAENYVLLTEKEIATPTDDPLLFLTGMVTGMAAALRGGAWYSYSKRDKKDCKFELSDEKYLPQDILSKVSFRARAYGDCAIYVIGGCLVSLDIGAQKVVTLKSGVKGDVLSDVVNAQVAYGGKEGLWLYNIQSKQTVFITAHQSSPIHAVCAFLTEEALYFVCEESNGWLDDGENPSGCLCKYDLGTQKSRVLTKLNKDENGVLAHHIGMGNGKLYVSGKDQYAVVSADASMGEVEVKRLSDYMVSKGNVNDSEELLTVADFAYQDGFAFVCGSYARQYLCFLHFVTGEITSYLLWDIAQQIKNDGNSQVAKEALIKYPKRLSGHDSFRLGNWLYYSLNAVREGDEDYDGRDLPYERWKISLETGERVKLSAGQ